VLAKHDENYMPREVVDELKKRGEWNLPELDGVPSASRVQPARNEEECL